MAHEGTLHGRWSILVLWAVPFLLPNYNIYISKATTASAWSLNPPDRYGPGSRSSSKTDSAKVEPISLSDILQQSTILGTEDYSSQSLDSVVHEYFMNQALAEAKNAGQRGEVPIGAIVVHNFTLDNEEVITSVDWSEITNTSSDSIYYVIESRASNQVEQNFNAAAHAELLALQQAAHKRQNWRLLGSTLYSTLEPCPMCLAASLAFRVDQVVYGAPDLRLGAIVTNPTNNPHPFHNFSNIVGDIRRNESADLLRSFFRQRRLEQQAMEQEGRITNNNPQQRIASLQEASSPTTIPHSKARRRLRNPVRFLWNLGKSLVHKP